MAFVLLRFEKLMCIVKLFFASAIISFFVNYKRRSKELLWYCVRYSVLFWYKVKEKNPTVMEVRPSVGSSISRWSKGTY